MQKPESDLDKLRKAVQPYFTYRISMDFLLEVAAKGYEVGFQAALDKVLENPKVT